MDKWSGIFLELPTCGASFLSTSLEPLSHCGFMSKVKRLPSFSTEAGVKLQAFPCWDQHQCRFVKLY